MNAFKHAFSENDSGQIRIEVLQNEKEFELKVIDNGKGLPEGFNMNSSNSLGVKLVKGLSRQIGGSCTFNSHNGTTATIKFKLD